ncbi:hypothetical protein ACQ4M3_23370 [Leptolyngbya sp. AN03gr2]|uniref:hypothetical protein n=1 Tax=unclassified Leptolyngbya TaxID=2650499 RepID=UPI003D3199A4
MLITDLAELETSVDLENLEGGTDWAATLTAYNQMMSVFQTGAVSGPNGSSAFSNIGRLDISTFGLSALVLGANPLSSWTF